LIFSTVLKTKRKNNSPKVGLLFLRDFIISFS